MAKFTRIYGEGADTKNFEPIITVTASTNMMGQVRVVAVNDYTDDPPVVLEHNVEDDDPAVTDATVAQMFSEAYLLASLT